MRSLALAALLAGLVHAQPALCQTEWCTPHPCTVENSDTICGPSCTCLVEGDDTEGRCVRIAAPEE